MIVVKTPLRLSFVGGGSDIKVFYEKQDGMVVSSAIDKFIYVIVKERFDDEIHVNYTKKEIVHEVDKVQHDLVREGMRITGIKRGVDVVTMADIPSEGSGLGSSSAVTVALLQAFYTYQNRLVSAEQLALEACKIEIDIMGKPIGKQDQYAVANGGFKHYIFRKDDTTETISLDLDNKTLHRFSSSLLLYYTGMTRDANHILAQQTRNYSAQEKFENMCKIVALVEPFKQSLEEGDIGNCGHLLDKNWQLKKEMAKGITNAKIEEMYSSAVKAGALGGKVAGAGGGGFLVLVVPREKQNTVMEAMREYRRLPFMLERSGSKVVFDNRGYATK